MIFYEFFQQTLQKKNSFLCIGIDPDIEKFPAGISRDVEGLAIFCREIIQATSEFTSAFKFNLAFFECWGWRGWQVLEKLLNAVPANVMLIADAKRGDIGNSSRFYAQAFFHQLPFHAITLSPYLGPDSLEPFIQEPQWGAFVLCVTSNPGGREVQEFGQPQPLYLHIADLVQSLNRQRNLGLVMGATKPEQLTEVRNLFPDLPFLIPGIGSQGGEMERAVAVCRRAGLGLINVSRGVLFPKEGVFPNNVRAMASHYQKQFAIKEQS